MPVTIDPRFAASLESLLDQRIGEAVREMEHIVRDEISTAFPPASDPGTPPHLRTGGLRDAVFSERVGSGDWAFGYLAVPGKEDQGLWLELGTGMHRHAPTGDGGVRLNASGGKTSVEPRPVLLPTLLNAGPAILESKLGGSDASAHAGGV